ncbi:hypothetical protein GE061_007009 [Apolygus lucorum]|uniref:Uncharacterized protein n=1 Tax=Apolygus lucorum TaxID=248454 RepID=A0A8S9WT26_APOLU|nr:hypothetical protein GE061_007009 [Apolygus lucorum]
MFMPTVLLLTLGALGTSGTVLPKPNRGHDVSQLLDDYLAFVEPIMRAEGNIETEIGGVSDSPAFFVGQNSIEHHLKKVDHPKVQSLLENPSEPIPFSFSCEKGKLGDLSTLKRIGPAVETLTNVVKGGKILTLKGQYTLETMYAKFPNCKFSLANLPFKGQITLKATHNNFTSTLDFYSLGKYCRFGIYPTSLNGPLELKTVVNGTPYNKLFEQLLEYLIRKHPNDVTIIANSKLQSALDLIAFKSKSCGFLIDGVLQHIKNKHL